MKVQRIGHFVLTVRGIEVICGFYSRVLGIEIEEFGGKRKALRFGGQKNFLHTAGKEFELKARKPVLGSTNYCPVTDVIVESVIEHLVSCGVEITEGPVECAGAGGRIKSVYFRSSDVNLVEVAGYSTG